MYTRSYLCTQTDISKSVRTYACAKQERDCYGDNNSSNILALNKKNICLLFPFFYSITLQRGLRLAELVESRVAESESPGVGGFGWSRNLKPLWSRKKCPIPTPKKYKNIYVFVYFTLAKLILNISLQVLQSWVA